MSAPKKNGQISATVPAGTPADETSPASPPEAPKDLTDAQLASVSGGSLPIDDYAATNYLEE